MVYTSIYIWEHGEHLSDGFLAELHSYKVSTFRSQERTAYSLRRQGPSGSRHRHSTDHACSRPWSRPKDALGPRAPSATRSPNRCSWRPNRCLWGWRLIPSNSTQGSAATESGSGQTLCPSPAHRVDILCAAGRRWSQDTPGTRTHRTGHT